MLSLSQVEEIVEKLIVWAHEVLEKSCNQSILPYAILAVNRLPSNRARPFDGAAYTKSMMDTIETLAPSKELDRFVKFWQAKGKEVKTLKSLLLSYYARIDVVAIPVQGNSNLLLRQVTELRDIIVGACKYTHKEKEKLGMKQDAWNLKLLLDMAFNHFASDDLHPFDFVQAWFKINPIVDHSLLVSGILQMVVTLQGTERSLKLDDLWNKIDALIVSYMMLDAERGGLPCK